MSAFKILTDGTYSYKCRGGCCSDFTLPVSPEEIEADRQVVKDGRPSRWGEDGPKLHEMYVYLGYRPDDPNIMVDATSTLRHHYTCKWFDAKVGLCTNYANRPEMCSRYPYSGECRYHACHSNPILQRWRITRPAFLWARSLYRRWQNKRAFDKVEKVVEKLASSSMVE